MALPTSPARALALAAALALAGCGGVPKGPILPDGPLAPTVVFPQPGAPPPDGGGDGG